MSLPCACGGTWWASDADGLLCCGLCGRESLGATISACERRAIHGVNVPLPCPICDRLVRARPLPLAQVSFRGDARANGRRFICRAGLHQLGSLEPEPCQQCRALFRAKVGRPAKKAGTL